MIHHRPHLICGSAPVLSPNSSIPPIQLPLAAFKARVTASPLRTERAVLTRDYKVSGKVECGYDPYFCSLCSPALWPWQTMRKKPRRKKCRHKPRLRSKKRQASKSLATLSRRVRKTLSRRRYSRLASDRREHLDEEMKNRIKDTLGNVHKLYEQHKFKEAATALEEAIKLGPNQSVLAYDLALCYYQLGDREQAAEYLRKSRAGTHDPKQRQRLLLLLAFVTTGENGSPAGESDRERINRLNRLAESIGLEASLQDDTPDEEDASAESDAAALQPTPVAETSLKSIAHAGSNTETNKGPRSSLCNALGEFKAASAKSASMAFNLANCAETNGRTAEAERMLQKYLEVAPTALDAPEARARIADLQSLIALPGSNGAEIRRLYASAYGALAERQYDRAQEAFRKAGDLAPEFPLTQWNLALLYEAMGDIDESRKKFTLFQHLVNDQGAKDEAALHLSTLDGKRTKYDEEIDEAEDLLADLFNRGMNLTFNGPENRRSLRAKRARVKKKEQNKSRNRVGGFAVPYAYAQQQLKRAR